MQCLIPFQKGGIRTGKDTEYCEDNQRYGKIFFIKGLSRLVCHLKRKLRERNSGNLKNYA